jgi:hypothetical protein
VYTVGAGRGAGAVGVGADRTGAGRFADTGRIGVYTTGPGAGCGLAPSDRASLPSPSTARLKTAWAASNRVLARLLIRGAYPGLGEPACFEPGQV